MPDLTQVPARERIDSAEAARLRKTESLITDDRRRRPLYFDGRFLAARDLTRDQDYFLTRQSDLGRVLGPGVVSGLMVSVVSRDNSVSELLLEAGLGVTPAGEMVMVPKPIPVPLTDLSLVRQIDSSLGLALAPREPARNLTGLFVVALRPVEFTAHPIASYPTSVTGPRTVEDGDIMEATAVTLVPFPDGGGREAFDQRRSRAARTIFLGEAESPTPANALPVAMIALSRGQLQWLDPFLVRREVGADQSHLLNFGFASRSLREAFLVQYDRHLQEVMETLNGRPFAAAEQFLALPSVGRMPANTISATDFTQSFFPSEVDAEISIVPEDEIPALIAEGTLLPPIDLTLSPDDQDSTSVLVLAPVTRARLRTLQAKLKSFRRPLLPAAPNLVARRKPLQILSGLTSLSVLVSPAQPTQPENAEWQNLLAAQPTLWYARRRNVASKAELTGEAATTVGNERDLIERRDTVLRNADAAESFAKLEEKSTPLARAELTTLVSSPKFQEANPVLVKSALHELGRKRTLNQAAVREVAEQFSAPGVGEGLKRLQASAPEVMKDPDVIQKIATSGTAADLDQVARSVSPHELPSLATEVGSAAKAKTVAPLRRVVRSRLSKKPK
jgi:hypothetical protein